ncbi:MAG: SWIM zinc finger family protein [Ilumatobacter sp.]|nr:SWIM zinc finger family protein [Ilumatobacter sp.]
MSIVIRPGHFHSEPHPAGKLATTLLAVTVAGMADPARFRRGKAYVADHAVTRLEVSTGTLRGSVQGSRAEPYEAIVATRLTARPHLGNAESFRTQLSQLVPDAGQLMVSCSCPDWDDPCKHAVATLLAFSEELTARPELLVEWRCHPAEEDAGGRPQVGSRAATGRHLRLAPPPPDHDPPTGDRPARQRTPPRTPSRALPPPPSPYQSPRWQAFLGALPFPDPPDLPTEPAPLGHAMLGPVDVGAWIRSAVELLTSLE